MSLLRESTEPTLVTVRTLSVNKYEKTASRSSSTDRTSVSSTPAKDQVSNRKSDGFFGSGEKRKALVYNDGTFSITLHHYDSLVSELKCPGCAQPLFGPINLCQTGHSVCSRCSSRLNTCPLCPKKVTEMRNYTLEAIASKVHFPCDHAIRGCTVRLPLELLWWHKDRCGFKQIDCFMGKVWENCRWIGCEKDWIEHCVSEHQDKVYNSPDIVLTWNYGADSQRCIQLQSVIAYYVIRAYGEYFNVYQIYDQNSHRSIWTVICATKKSRISNRFAFELELYSPIESAKLLVQRFSCHSESDADFLKDGNCAKIAIQDAIRFMTKEKVLYYRIRIIEVAPSRSRSLVMITQSHQLPGPPSYNALPINYSATRIENVNIKAVAEKNIIVRNGIEEKKDEPNPPTQQELDQQSIHSNESSAASTITEEDPEQEALPEEDRQNLSKAAIKKATSTPILGRVNSFPKPPRVHIQASPKIQAPSSPEINSGSSGQHLVRCRLVERQDSIKMKPIYSGNETASQLQKSSESLNSYSKGLSKFYNLTTYKAASKLWSKK
ncbi:uncharacterized protein LOC129723427 [Wyeomyia smithii]|uniref:uncharacterized protein LOC129723427 n=1 Tax=Wyeomyia smithii TaxID=174621 RepID=UPI002467CF5F|nr:uncharacterized protein LOC129723427 [Wyeomyia smithii]XP_055533622.1 uncharacterized protein LOC129723427 [Wyeomyia smithii]